SSSRTTGLTYQAAIDRPGVVPGKASILLKNDTHALRHAALHCRTVETDLPMGRLLKAADHLEQRRLATTRRSDHCEELSLDQFQVERTKRMDVLQPAA